MKRGVWLSTGVVLFLAVGWVALAADPPTSPSKDKPADKQENNRVKYARTYVQLAKLDLEMAQARNREVPETLPPGIMLAMEEHVALAELWLKEEEGEAAGQPLTDVVVKMAEIRLKAAELSLKQMEAANRIARQPSQKMERLRLQAELARLNVAGAKELDSKSPIELLEFEFERLREDVSELYIHQIRLLDRN
jgi:hypothetical protein